MLRFSLAVVGLALVVVVSAGAVPPKSAARAHASAANADVTWFSACATGRERPRSRMDVDLPRMQTTGSAPVNSLYTITAGYDPSCDAFGFYQDTVEENGWSYLHVESNSAATAAGGVSLTAWQRAYASGFLEGALTAGRMAQSFVNAFASTFPETNGTAPPTVYTFIDDQNAWIQEQLALAEAKDDPYWLQVNAVYGQLEGLFDGYQSAVATQGPASPAASSSFDRLYGSVQMSDILIANLLGEVGDMQKARDPAYRARHDVQRMTNLRDVKREMDLDSHCSALIRLAPDGQDLYSTHTTWTGFANMLRIYKYYGPFTSAGADGNAIQFSSFPGCVSSIDDYYQVRGGPAAASSSSAAASLIGARANLVVIETTNNIANSSLYDLVTPRSVPTFVRVMVANGITSNGSHWAEVYAENNSGTYNNQWMVVDHNQFTPGQGAGVGTLWIASQIPGDVETADVTEVLLKQGYWASYNIPFFADLWATLGYGQLVERYGANGQYLWNYTASFRAEIFARDAPKVKTLADMQAIIQENNWQTDPLSHGSAELAIAARMDLSSGPLGDPRPTGAIDAKLTAWSLMRPSSPLQVLAKSGPTVETQTPFTWSTSAWADLPHEGQPDTFDFDWVTFQVQTPPSATTNRAQQPHPKIALE